MGVSGDECGVVSSGMFVCLWGTKGEGNTTRKNEVERGKRDAGSKVALVVVVVVTKTMAVAIDHHDPFRSPSSPKGTNDDCSGIDGEDNSRSHIRRGEWICSLAISRAVLKQW